MKKYIINLDEYLADTLEDQCKEINSAFNEKWTPETLAASFLRHVLLDDLECHCGRHCTNWHPLIDLNNRLRSQSPPS